MKQLTDICHIPVKFSEIDSMRIVWHGNYVAYFEDGRESFSRRYPGIGYDTMQKNGIYAPVYDVHLRHYASLEMNDVAIIHTTYITKAGARLDFKYQIFRERDNQLCCEGETIQLFIDTNGQLLIESPRYYQEWKQKWFPSLFAD